MHANTVVTHDSFVRNSYLHAYLILGIYGYIIHFVCIVGMETILLRILFY